jgi:hypothetical protein
MLYSVDGGVITSNAEITKKPKNTNVNKNKN